MSEIEALEKNIELLEEILDEGVFGLEEMMEEGIDENLQCQIDNLAKRHPNGSRLAKRAIKNPNKAAKSRKFIKETRAAVKIATIFKEIELADGEKIDEEVLSEVRQDLLKRYVQALEKQPEKESKAIRNTAMLSIALHVGIPAAIGATQIDYHDLRRDITDLVTAQGRKIRRGVRELIGNETKANISTEGLFDKDEKEMSPKEWSEWKKKIQDIIIYRPDLAKKYIDEGKLDLDKFLDMPGGEFYKRFYIETESLRGTSKEDTLEAEEKMRQLYKTILDERRKDIDGNINPEGYSNGSTFEGELKLLAKITKKYGEDATWAANYMGDLARREFGNCASRTKLNLAILADIPWRHVNEVKVQLIGLHIRPIIKMSDGNWYTMDGTLRKLPTSDLSGTAILDRHMDVKRYIKAHPEVRIMDENRDMKNRLDLRVLIIGELLSGIDNYLGGEISERLISVYDLRERRKAARRRKRREKAITAATIEVTIESDPYNNDKGGGPRVTQDEAEQPEYIIPENDLLHGRITGEIDLKGKNLKDLEQLRDAEVSHINLEGTSISDLKALKDIPLESININKTGVTEISILADKPLKVVKLGHTRITDLSPLKGMAIEELDLSGWTIDENTIEILKTMQLKKLILHGVTIKDLSILKGLPIEVLDLTNSIIDDYTGLKDLPKLRVLKKYDSVVFEEGLYDLAEKNGFEIDNGMY